jgi:hypothetical protein
MSTWWAPARTVWGETTASLMESRTSTLVLLRVINLTNHIAKWIKSNHMPSWLTTNRNPGCPTTGLRHHVHMKKWCIDMISLPGRWSSPKLPHLRVPNHWSPCKLNTSNRARVNHRIICPRLSYVQFACDVCAVGCVFTGVHIRRYAH